MRVFSTCVLLLGSTVPSLAQRKIVSFCSVATTQEECFGLADSGEDCVWNSIINFENTDACVHRSNVAASVYGWKWEGRPSASSEGTKKTIHPDSATITHFNDFETQWGESAAYGEFQTYIRSGPDGRPTAIGLSIPTDLEKIFPRDDASDPGSRFDLPKEHPCSKAIPFDHIMLNYAATGHPGGYQMENLLEAFQGGSDALRDVIATSSFYQRHLDVDFHLDSPEESNNIKCSRGVFPNCLATEEETAEFENVPSPDYAPPAFAFDPISKVPFKGVHWQPAAGVSDEAVRDEYAPNFGTYGGRVVLWEAMVTMTSLKDLKLGVEKEWDYAVPTKVQKTGYYPTKFVIRKAFKHGLASDAERVYQIELTDMVFRLGDDSYKGNGKLKQNMSEDAFCPAITCEADDEGAPQAPVTTEFCTTCGTIGVRAVGRRHAGTKTVKMENSCECTKYCKGLGAEGYKFVQHQTNKNKKGKCTCLNDIVSGKKFDLRHTSAVFEESR